MINARTIVGRVGRLDHQRPQEHPYVKDGVTKQLRTCTIIYSDGFLALQGKDEKRKRNQKFIEVIFSNNDIGERQFKLCEAGRLMLITGTPEDSVYEKRNEDGVIEHTYPQKQMMPREIEYLDIPMASVIKNLFNIAKNKELTNGDKFNCTAEELTKVAKEFINTAPERKEQPKKKLETKEEILNDLTSNL